MRVSHVAQSVGQAYQWVQPNREVVRSGRLLSWLLVVR
jgi:hypothetical protein